ncbi:hypothetical protein PLICRDRAFT_120297 [Plicaturopsis crispa FD-325 SS-3]|uniref:Unplaced genomic scaffold PLICRscaffold_111, whole genome shotgun sequence n=1 Tax=Plicaturopsis crispa FD-325 SS-3 TaxID=944288 RepID=A0A0C9SJY1_PLICR|nr:hypothetical protein PLICRDRAFT_120297 [Plicaturopsis crispa FD-325 SS-3]
MQQQRLIEPVPSSIWRVIIKDQYVDFEKLFASMETGYNHRDEAQDFHAGFALVKKDQATARKPLQSEADWLRVFGGGCLFTPRSSELTGYHQIVISLFRRQLPLDPHIGIFSFNRDIRETYDKSPFSLDDRNQLAVPIFAQMYKSGSKCSSSSSPIAPSSLKHSKILCINWNQGGCTASSSRCDNGRTHGTCTECGEAHCAFDKPACRAS